MWHHSGTLRSAFAACLMLGSVVSTRAEEHLLWFEFDCNEPISPARIAELGRLYGSRVMIGVSDVGRKAQSVKAARRVGAQLMVYLEGPGGETGSSGIATDEMQRMKAGARSVGIDVSRRGWMKAWNAWGWKLVLQQKLAHYASEGFSAAEIDNLPRAGIEGPARQIEFFKEYAHWHERGVAPKLMLKNMSQRELAALKKALAQWELRRSLFADFAISEGGDRKRQAEIAKSMGIQMLHSFNTYHYAAKGPFNANVGLVQ